MKQYLSLQLKMLKRKIFTPPLFINPKIHLLTVISLFIGMSLFLFFKIQYAGYIYVCISLALTAKLSETKRNDFLRLCFGDSQHRKIRITENLIACSPFMVLLLVCGQFLLALILSIISVIMALFTNKHSFNLTIPTLFFSQPFEFIIGFRNSIYVFIIAYALTVLAIIVDNFYIGLFSLVIIFVTIFCFYLYREDEYFVWIHSGSPVKFLCIKILTAIQFSLYLFLPVIISLACFYPTSIIMSLVIIFAGFFYLILVICAKYASFPNEMDIPRGMLVFFSFIVPLLLFLTIPLFFNQAVKRLGWYLV